MTCPLTYRPRTTARVETYTAWSVSPESTRREGRRLAIGEPASLEAALGIAKELCSRKHTLVIRASNALSGQAMVHFYAIQESAAPKWNPGPVTRGCNITAKPLLSIRCDDFAPAEPWMATSGADRVNGNDGCLGVTIAGEAGL